MFKAQITTIVSLLFSAFGYGQNTVPVIEWQKNIGGMQPEGIVSTVLTSDGGYAFIGEANSTDGDLAGVEHNYGDVWVVKVSASNKIEWQKKLGGTESERGCSIVQASDGGYAVLAYTPSNDIDVSGNHGRDDAWLVKLSASGSIQWQKCLGGSSTELAYGLIKTADDGYAVLGRTTSNDGDVSGNNDQNWGNGWVVKLSSTGVIQWQKCLGGSAEDRLYSIAQTKDGGYIVAGETISTDGDVSGNHGAFDAWVVKLSSLGVLEWQKCLGGSRLDFAKSIIQTKDGGYILAAETNSNNGDVSGNDTGIDYDIWVVKLSALGAIEWQKLLGGSGDEQAQSIIQAADGGYIIAASTSSNNGDITNPRGSIDGWIIKINTQGQLEWQKSLGGSSADKLLSILKTPDGGYLATGYSASNDIDVTNNKGSTDAWIVKLSPDAKAIKGQLELTNTQCQPLTPPQYIANGQIKIEKNNAFFYVSTDAIGRFGVFVDTGLYAVSAIPPNELWTACPTQTINIINPTIRDTTVVNPSLYINSLCPLMEVELTTPFLRRCFESTYTINYANRGTALQTDAVVELTLDTLLSFVSATKPIRTQNGNKITFSIGNVGINQVGQFDVTVKVSCDSRLGQTHCSTVMIPKTLTCDTIRDTIPTIIIPCNGCDSIAFSVNRPTTGQAQTYQYRLIADVSTIDTGRFVLNNTFSIKHKNDGRTYRLEVRNGNNQLLAARAAESNSSTPSVSTGFVNQFARGIKLSNVAENCTANRGSFDPNEKSAIPVGVGTNHFVEQGTALEYLVQFQNTGTDTAFTVVVKDTLSPLFNFSTIKISATSHPASWELKPNGLLTVSFKNIHLVDSLTNERGSHGFFKYQIRLKDSIATGTRLDNKAAIYFDFNPPIITNLASHTIGKDFIKNCLAKPTVAITYTGCPSKNITFNAVAKNGGTSLTYSWFRNNETTPLSINATLTLNNMVNGTKIYCKIQASTDLCTETPTVTSDTIKINCINTKTDDIAALQSFDIYPNPNKGVFDIQVQLTKTAKVQVQIINTLGQVLKTERVLTDHFSGKYDLLHLSKGFYFVKVTIDEQSIVKRVSVQ